MSFVHLFCIVSVLGFVETIGASSSVWCSMVKTCIWRTTPKRKKQKGTLKMVTVECLVLGWTCQLCTTVISVWKVSQCDSDTVYSFFSVWPSFLTHGSTRVNPRTQKFSDCSFLSNNFVMICAGGLAIVPACRLANNCSHFSSCLCICIFICWLFIVLMILIYFSIQGESECHTCCLLLVLWRVFFLPIGREGRPFAFSWKGKHKHEMLTFFIFYFCYLALKWEVKLM